MTGTAISIEIDGFEEALRKLNALTDPKVLFKLADFAGFELKGLTNEAFERGKDPVTGDKWEPSRRASISGGQTLWKRGDLFRSVQHEAFSDGSLLHGSNKIYARIHQEGGQAGRNKKVTIPQRRFLGHPDDWLPKLLVMPEVGQLLEPV